MNNSPFIDVVYRPWPANQRPSKKLLAYVRAKILEIVTRKRNLILTNRK